MDKTQGAYLVPLIRLTLGSLQPVENKQALTTSPTLPANTILCDQPSLAQPSPGQKPGLPPSPVGLRAHL